MSRSPLIAAALSLATAAGGLWVASCLPEPHSLVGRACDVEHPCGEEELACCQGTCQLASPGLGCNEPKPPSPQDGGTTDGGLADGGDGGGPGDGGLGDGGPPDAGSVDAGASSDAGSLPDAGPPDAGPPDSCPPNLLTVGGLEQASDLASHYNPTGSATLSWTTAVARTGQGAARVQHTSASGDDFFGMELNKEVLTGLTVNTPYCVAAWLQRGNVRGQMRLITRHYSASSGADINTARVMPPDGEWFLILNDQAALSSTYDRYLNFRTSVRIADGSEYFVDDLRVWRAHETEGCDPRCAQ